MSPSNLVHSLGDVDFAARDDAAARAFAHAAAEAGVQRIVYLGGLGEDADDLSAHLRSRRQVEDLLGADGVPVTTLSLDPQMNCVGGAACE